MIFIIELVFIFTIRNEAHKSYNYFYIYNLYLKYIYFNTEKREKASNNLEKDSFNLLNNNIYVKTMDDVRNIMDVRLTTNAKYYQKLVSKLSFVSRKIWNKNFIFQSSYTFSKKPTQSKSFILSQKKQPSESV